MVKPLSVVKEGFIPWPDRRTAFFSERGNIEHVGFRPLSWLLQGVVSPSVGFLNKDLIDRRLNCGFSPLRDAIRVVCICLDGTK